jgi:cell division protein FtsB
MAYNRNRTSHNKKNELYYIFCIVTVVVILLFSFLGPHGYSELRKTRLDLQEQCRRVENLKRGNDDRKKNIEALRSDPEALERYARDKGYGREGEIIQQLPSQPPKKAN